MLTTDLLKFRRQNGQIKLQFIPLDSPNGLEICSAILALYNDAYKNRLSRGELAQLVDGIVKGSNDVIFAQGIVKLIDDKAEFLNHSQIDYPVARRDIFLKSFAILQNPPQDFNEYQKLLEPNLASFPNGEIFGDLPEFEQLVSLKVETPQELLKRYNLGLVQGLLLHADTMKIQINDDDHGEIRRTLKYLRFFRLLSEVTCANINAPNNLKIEISGPFSIFCSSRKYALNLASFFPAIVRLKNWELEAIINIGKTPAKLKLDQSSNLESHYRGFSAYIPEEVKLFHKQFEMKVKTWQIVGDTPLMPDGHGHMIVPDLSFEHKKTKKRIHLELFHRWHAKQVQERVELIAKDKKLNLILGIDRGLLDDNAFMDLMGKYPEAVPYCYRFRDYPGVDNTLKILDRIIK